jgi:hypothetical protein
MDLKTALTIAATHLKSEYRTAWDEFQAMYDKNNQDGKLHWAKKVYDRPRYYGRGVMLNNLERNLWHIACSLKDGQDSVEHQLKRLK